jgi:adenine phosphoribosyltransferase
MTIEDKIYNNSLFPFPIIARSRSQLGTPLDGRYGAMTPSELRLAINTLIQRANLEGVDYIVGIPEGGMIPAYEFASSINKKLVLASHSQPENTDAIKFFEPHSIKDRSAKYIYGLKKGDTVIVVEDEITTGRTIINCVNALRQAGISCTEVVSIYCADGLLMYEKLKKENIKLNFLWNISQDIVDELLKES